MDCALPSDPRQRQCVPALHLADNDNDNSLSAAHGRDGAGCDNCTALCERVPWSVPLESYGCVASEASVRAPARELLGGDQLLRSGAGVLRVLVHELGVEVRVPLLAVGSARHVALHGDLHVDLRPRDRERQVAVAGAPLPVGLLVAGPRVVPARSRGRADTVN
jgi:hypothetical protein